MAAFAIKAPLFPFHTWLPDVHTEAPTAGSVVLAGVILKMGAYGFLRFSFELFPQASVDFAPILLIARGDRHHLRRDRRRDADRPRSGHRLLVGRAHGLRRPRHLLAHRHRPRRRACSRWCSHPLTTGALFLLVGMLYERRHTRELVDVPRRLEGRAGARRPVPRRDCSPASGCPASRASSASSSSLLGRVPRATGRTRSSRPPA